MVGGEFCVAGVSDYERRQIQSLLPSADWAIDEGAALVLLPLEESFERIYTAAIAPALAKAGLNRADVRRVFDDDSLLAEVATALTTAQLIVADVTALNPSILYVLGLAHAVGRSPLLISRHAGDLPFDLWRLRCIEYTPTANGLLLLRQRLARAVRIFVAASQGGQ